MIVVIDASVAVMWLMAEASSPAANALLRSPHELVAVDLLRLEVCSAILKGARVKRISTADAALAATAADRLPVRLFPAADHASAAFAIALRHGGTVYDASYVALARSLSAPLATDDDGMATIAGAVGVTAHRATDGFAALLQ